MSDNEVPPSNDIFAPERATIRQSLNEITAQLNSALVKEELAYPVYLCIPNSGDALATIACPVDPSDEEWDRIVKIVSKIVGKKIGAKRLRTRALSCAMAGASMAGANITAG